MDDFAHALRYHLPLGESSSSVPLMLPWYQNSLILDESQIVVGRYLRDYLGNHPWTVSPFDRRYR